MLEINLEATFFLHFLEILPTIPTTFYILCVHGNNIIGMRIIIMPPVLGILIVLTISKIFVRALYSYGNLAKSGTKCQVPSHKSHDLG